YPPRGRSPLRTHARARGSLPMVALAARRGTPLAVARRPLLRSLLVASLPPFPFRLPPSPYRGGVLDFLGFPVGGAANSAGDSTVVGHLKCASVARQCAIRSSSVASAPGFSTTSAFTVSPHLSSGTPITHASATPACWYRQSSTSMELTFSPPEMITSF